MQESLAVGLRDIRLKQDRKLPVCWLVFIIVRGNMLTAKEEKSTMILPIAGSCRQQCRPTRHDKTPRTIVTSLLRGN